MVKVRHWINECISSHSRCRSAGDSVLPARVLDIGLNDASSITLRESKGETGRYICLSYCWGGSEFTMTTPDTIESHRRGINLQDLPQIFQDSIKIARALGIQYLWIDALCIIQHEEDHADWKRECGCMADIFRNAYLTVAATSANSPTGGCFTPAADGITIGPVIMRRISHFPLPASAKMSVNFPLLSRAWAYQERMLAPRVVHFGRHEMLWDCVEHRTCECNQAGYHQTK